MSGKRLARNADVLKALLRVDNVTRNALLSAAKKDLVLALVDCAKFISRQKVPLTTAQYNKLRRLSAEIRTLVNPRASLAERRRVLQTGGFVGALIGPVLRILPSLLGGLLSGGR